ncbi:MAG: HEAT repeat domain-containing protein [Anaerolineae bacterium]|nr:HEAT repeat domain-containing protein [Anaerolineae bacterium]
MARKKQIFLSYRSSEVDFALKLAADLKNSGINLWIDRLDVKPGDDWRIAIQDAIDQASGMIAILSTAYTRSHYCKRELARADRYHYPIVPILITPLDDKAWPIEVEREQYLDFTNWRDDDAYRKQLDRLVENLIERYDLQIDKLPNEETRYLNSLIAELEARLNLSLAKGEAIPLQANALVDDVFRQIFDPDSPDDEPDQPRILRLINRTPRFILLGMYDPLRTLMIEYAALQTAYTRRDAPKTTPMPYLVRLADWKQDIPLADFLKHNWKLDSNIEEETAAGRMILFIDGVETLAGSPRKLLELRAWIHKRRYIILACRTADYTDTLKLGIPTVTLPEITDLNPILLLQEFSHDGEVDKAALERTLRHWLQSLPPAELSPRRFKKHISLFEGINPQTLLETLVSLVRYDNWQVRHAASLILQSIPTPQFGNLSSVLEQMSFLEDINYLTEEGQAILPSLVRMLSHENSHVRCRAALALGELGDTAAVPALVEALRDKDISVVLEAVNTLGVLADRDSFPYLVKLLDHDNLTLQEAASQVLVWLGAAVIPTLKETAHHGKLSLRLAAIGVLRALDDPMAIEVLLQATHDKHPSVRAAALEALQNTESEAVIKRLIECLKDNMWCRRKKQRVSDTAFSVLRTMDTPDSHAALSAWNKQKKRESSARRAKNRLHQVNGHKPGAKPRAPTENSFLDMLLKKLHNTDWGNREAAAQALREYAKSMRGSTPDYVTDQLVNALDDKAWMVRWASAEALAWIKDISTVPKLAKLLEDDNWMVRTAAINALIEIQDVDALEALMKCAQDKHPMVRANAIEALGNLKSAKAVPMLAQILSSEKIDSFLRLAAVESLGKISDKSVVKPLTSALNDVEKNVRWAAVQALSRLADETVIESLIPLLHDINAPFSEKKRICDLAVEALEHIGTPKAKEALSYWQIQQTGNGASPPIPQS